MLSKLLGLTKLGFLIMTYDIFVCFHCTTETMGFCCESISLLSHAMNLNGVLQFVKRRKDA